MSLSTKCIQTIKCLFISYLLTIILLALLALCVYSWNLGSTFVNICIICIYIITCFLGGFILGKSTKSKRFIWGMLLGLAYMFILMIIAYAMNHNINLTSASNLTTLLLCVGGGMLGGMVS